MPRELLPGTYGCVPTGGPTGRIISHGTGSPYSHSFFVLPGGKISEARPGGAGEADLEPVIRAGAVFNDQEPLSSDFRRDLCQLAVSRHGAAYDWPAILNLSFRVLGRKSPLLPVGTRGAFICSQWVTVLSTEVGKSYCPDLDRWMVSPRILADRITRREWETT